MKIKISLLLLIFIFTACTEKKANPQLSDVIAVEIGDLNDDGLNEKVVVYDTRDTTEFGIVREIQILKKENGIWTVWSKSKNAILKSYDGGMFGDPFIGIKIKNGILLIEHYGGGGSFSWHTLDKYRFQNNNFELIGITNHGEEAGSKGSTDFNLSTGKLKKEHFDFINGDYFLNESKSETFYKKGIQINLSNRNNNELIITSPKTGKDYYL